MRSKLLRVTVACAAFVAGVSVASIYRYVQQQRSVAQAEVSAPSPNPAPELPLSEECPSYPETSGTSPHEIVNFIEDHPKSNLSGLWQRLKVTDDAGKPVQFNLNDGCTLTEADIFEYNLDNDAAREVVLQLKHQFRESYRYLVFKDSWIHEPKLLGKIDVWAKYRPSDPVVLESNGQAWLIVQSTAATGSGLGAWVDTVYDVSNGRLKEVASYLGEISQAGHLGFPSKAVSGRLVSCEIKNGKAIVDVAYTVEYSGHSDKEIPLFTTRKTAVLVGSRRNGFTRVDTARSEISPNELETIYNFDSMGEEDFLTYNREELRAIAIGDDAEKKAWLKEFLDSYGTGAIKHELLQLMH